MKRDTVKHPVNLSAKIRITSKITANEQNKLVLSPVSRAKLAALKPAQIIIRKPKALTPNAFRRKSILTY
ncbi:MAG: hypothetical protein MSS78_03690 [Bacteroidales bacterium]|nr:hypothetical protein [Bacteroidales bacterium]